MDPLSLISLIFAYAGAAVAQKCAEKPVEDGWNFIGSFLGGIFGRDPSPQEFNAQVLRTTGADRNVEVLEEAHNILASTPALRRAELVAPILRHAQVLWVDDEPENNVHEREALRALGANTDVTTSTAQGMDALRGKVYDLVISDMSRDDVPDEGLALLREIRESRFPQPVVFYLGAVEPEKGIPDGSFGITHRPDELLHLVMDVLERQRV